MKDFYTFVKLLLLSATAFFQTSCGEPTYVPERFATVAEVYSSDGIYENLENVPCDSFEKEVLADKRTSEEAEMVMRKSAGHSTEEASNDRGGKDPR